MRLTSAVRRLGLLLGAASFCAAVAVAVVYGRRRLTRVAVSGHSMEPALRDGDWLIVDRKGKLSRGSVVVAHDPRAIGRIVVKRIAEVGTDSQLVLASDHPAHADEVIGPVSMDDALGVVRLRYAPHGRIGLIR